MLRYARGFPKPGRPYLHLPQPLDVSAITFRGNRFGGSLACNSFKSLRDKVKEGRGKTGGMMETGTVGKESICGSNEIELPIGEKRLWLAVLLQAVEDWQSDRIRSRRDAEQFLLHDHQDFETVCAAAGLEPGNLRARVLRLRAGVHSAAQARLLAA